MRMVYQFFWFWFLFWGGLSPVFDKILAENTNDLNIIKNRIIQLLIKQKIDTQKIGQLLESVKPDGSWDHIDYQDKTLHN